MKEKFYLVTEEIYYECENHSPRPKLFKNKVKAVAYFNERQSEVYSNNLLKEDWITETHTDQIECYEDGYFAHNRHCVYLSEVEIED